MFEPKYDGYRASAILQGAAVRLVSRRGTDLTPLFPELAAAVLDPVPEGTQLDADIVIYQDGQLSFDALQQRMAAGARRARALAGAAPRR